MNATGTFKVTHLARVEGDGGFSIKFKDGKVCEAKFDVFEPPRLFEAFLRGRHFAEVPDMTARICGICPLAHMLAATQAMETALGLSIPPEVAFLRELMFLGEWIASHSLHIHLLHAPDFFDCPDVIALSRRYPDIVKRGLRLKQVGNDIVRLIGGREVHPVNLRIGEFFKMPPSSAIASLKQDLTWAREAAMETVRWTAGLTFPEFEQDYVFLALHDPEQYAIMSGRFVASTGENLAADDFETFVTAEQVSYSTALHGLNREHGAYLVGPMARFNLNFPQLSSGARQVASEIDLKPPCTNPFKSIVIRSVEMVHACERILLLMDRYAPVKPSSALISPCAATGYGCVEAPRGVCWHKYRMDAFGNILDARIVPPTSQNLRRMEMDLKAFGNQFPDLTPDRLVWQCEQLVRCFDPCISCSCHALHL